MRRRHLLALPGLPAMVVPLVGHSQAPRRIGYSRFAPPDAKHIADFLGGWKRLATPGVAICSSSTAMQMAITIGCQTWRAISFVGISKS
jgi:hypothetical protein